MNGRMHSSFWLIWTGVAFKINFQWVPVGGAISESGRDFFLVREAFLKKFAKWEEQQDVI